MKQQIFYFKSVLLIVSQFYQWLQRQKQKKKKDFALLFAEADLVNINISPYSTPQKHVLDVLKEE